MPILRIEITKNLTEVVELTGPITIGRGKDNDIILLDGVVSRHHSRIYFDGPDVIIEDLNSANGTYVNGNRVFLRALQDKDIMHIGQPAKATKIYFSTEKWEKPPLEIDLMTHKVSEFDMQEIINARDIYFKFPSDDANINLIYDVSRQKFDFLPITDMEKINLDAALNEAVGNAQRHGHKYKAEMPIEFRYIHKPDKLIIQVTDQGEGFDYRAELERKRAGTAVEEARARYKTGGYGGLGIMLMLKCVDHVDYNRKGNQVTLTKYLGEAAKKFQEEQKKSGEDKDNKGSPSPKDEEGAKEPESAGTAQPKKETAEKGKEAPDKTKQKDKKEEFPFLIEPD